ncbi:MAG: tetratricopeptide repeat protein [Smithella sp.]
MEPTPRPRKTAKTSKKRATKSKPVSWQKRFAGIWQEYNIPIFVLMIFSVMMFFLTSKEPDINIKTDQTIKTESPSIETPSVNNQIPPQKTDSGNMAKSADDLLKDALALCSSGKCKDPQKAIEYLNEAIKQKPDWAGAYNNRGNAYANLGQSQKAIEDYNEAIRLKSDYVQAYSNRGNAFTDLGQYQRAIEDYNEAIRLTPDFAYSYANRGNAYLIQGSEALACNDLQKACDLGMCSGLEKAKSQGKCR